MPDHISHRPPQSGAIRAGQIGLIVLLIVVITAGVLLLTGIWPFGKDPTPAPQPAAEVEGVTPVAVEPAAEPAPEPQPEPPAEPLPEPDPLPKLDESDDAIRDAIADIPWVPQVSSTSYLAISSSAAPAWFTSWLRGKCLINYSPSPDLRWRFPSLMTGYKSRQILRAMLATAHSPSGYRAWMSNPFLQPSTGCYPF